jgi:CMP-2-keto-3-deoxyoctulosonic acid synthetase
MIPREPCPDESEYVAVITLLNSDNGNIKPYVFKLKPDGSFLYRIPFEYNKQPIEKWVKYMRRWLADFEAMEAIRAQWRCDTIKQELIEKTWVRADSLEWD